MILFVLQNKKQNVMKNIFKTSLFVSLFAVFAVSCVEEQYIDNDVWSFAKEYDVSTEKWLYDDVDDLFYYDVHIKELTNQIYNEGILAGYFVYFVNNNKVDSPLPYSQFFIDSSGYQWSYQYTCEFSPGKVTFIFRDSDYAVSNPPACTFLIKMMR